MKFAKRTISVLLAVLMLVSILPLSVSAASLKITTQPKTSYTEYGATAKATIKATGDGLKYTWYVKNAGASKYTKSSVTKSTYTAKMTDSIKGRSVYCVVKDKKGKTVKSSTAILRMKATITTEPKTTYAQQGATAKLTVKAKGDGLKYAWYIKNAGKTKYTKSSITKSTYSTTMSDSVHGRYVYCVVTDKYGKTDKSKTVVLRQSATIVTQPKTTYAQNGATAKLTVKAKGDGLKYAWYIKNAGGSKYTKSSITKSTYSVTMSDKVDGRYVYCIVTDKYGKTEKSKTVALKKVSPLLIVAQPANVEAVAGEKATFSVEVSGGKAPYDYFWEYYCDAKGEWTSFEDKFDSAWADGFVDDKLTVSVTDDLLNGNYRFRCFIEDSTGMEVTTSEVKVIEGALKIIKQPEDVFGYEGDKATFSVKASGGKAPYTYQWEYTYSGQGWYKCDGIFTNGYNTDTMSTTITEDDFNKMYWYRCKITDATGNSIYSLEVRPRKAVIIIVNPKDVTGSVGDTVEFTSYANYGLVSYSYQWQMKYGTSVWGNIPGATDSTLKVEITHAHMSADYQYRCVITDKLGMSATSKAAALIRPFTITVQPQNFPAAVNETAYFVVTAIGGKAPYTYQWEFKSDRTGGWSSAAWASGATTDIMSFKVTSTQEWTDNYQYRCVITDANGNKMTTNVVKVLNKDDLLRITSQPVNDYGRHGQQNTFTVQVAGGKGPYTYQWQWSDYSQSWRDITNNEFYSGAKTNMLDVIVMQADFDYETKYRCIITDADGTQVITNAVWSIEY